MCEGFIKYIDPEVLECPLQMLLSLWNNWKECVWYFLRACFWYCACSYLVAWIPSGFVKSILENDLGMSDQISWRGLFNACAMHCFSVQCMFKSWICSVFRIWAVHQRLFCHNVPVIFCNKIDQNRHDRCVQRMHNRHAQEVRKNAFSKQ